MALFFNKKNQAQSPKYDVANKEPIIKASICNGEQVAGFRDIQTGEFNEVTLIRGKRDLEEFKQRYGIAGEIKKVY
ncbi:MAG: aspartate dehydrogenase [Eubacterium sp.]|nr:aspartate dehydrogenase [Eubacterium sp.]